MTKDSNKQLTVIRPLPHEGSPTMPKDIKPQVEDAIDKTANPPETGEAMKKGASTALVHWKDRMAAVKVVAQEAEKPQGGFISFKGGRMTYGDELLPGDKINCVIVDYRMENDLYMTKYVAGVTRSPDCFAIVRPDEVLAPSPDAENPQNDTCDGCRMNEWGSASLIPGNDPAARGKGCKTSRRIMILAADDCTTVEKIAKAQVVTLIPPATSVDNFSTMMNQVTKALDTAMFGAVVEISVKPHPKFLFQVHFKVLQQINNEDLLEALLARHEKETLKVITYPKNSEREGGTPPAQSNKY
jgi:hypothetical protein